MGLNSHSQAFLQDCQDMQGVRKHTTYNMKSNLSVETNSDLTQMLELREKDIHTSIRTVFHVFKKLRWDGELIKKIQVGGLSQWSSA